MGYPTRAIEVSDASFPSEWNLCYQQGGARLGILQQQLPKAIFLRFLSSTTSSLSGRAWFAILPLARPSSCAALVGLSAIASLRVVGTNHGAVCKGTKRVRLGASAVRGERYHVRLRRGAYSRFVPTFPWIGSVRCCLCFSITRGNRVHIYIHICIQLGHTCCLYYRTGVGKAFCLHVCRTKCFSRRCLYTSIFLPVYVFFLLPFLVEISLDF